MAKKETEEATQPAQPTELAKAEEVKLERYVEDCEGCGGLPLKGGE